MLFLYRCNKAFLFFGTHLSNKNELYMLTDANNFTSWTQCELKFENNILTTTDTNGTKIEIIINGSFLSLTIYINNDTMFPQQQVFYFSMVSKDETIHANLTTGFNEWLAKQTQIFSPPVPLIKPSEPTAVRSYPESYSASFTSGSSKLNSARALLDDYTKGDNAFVRFAFFHWNRHHVDAVADIVRKIDKGQIKNEAQLRVILKNLEENNVINPDGSIARRISYIVEKLNESAPINYPQNQF
jgi:hypothetical protein